VLRHPENKYSSFQVVSLPDRTWPDKVISHAPRWLSTDLRDGNQAIFEPMNSEEKLRFFNMLTAIGFREIEVAFPAASQTEFDFVRTLIENHHIPSDVTIQVLTQAREDLIRRTMHSLHGAKQAIVHIYTATSKMFLETVFGMTKNEVTKMAVDSTKLIRELAAEQPQTKWTLEYSPEMFSQTELTFARDICDAVVDAWGATTADKVILNLPATVEVCTPNVYADQIEWMGRNLAQRGSVVLSLHPHNDRGTAVAAAEFGLMAGADRIEGCLFGNGERTGNVDIVTLALNQYTRGIDPGLDFSSIDTVAQTVTELTQIPIHPRQPYVGDLVHTAFSGSHQDAMRKGMRQRASGGPNTNALWDMPYLPIDPHDIGRSLEHVIRVNSQSGKGGIAHLLETSQGLIIPRRLQIEFSGVVQKYTERVGTEVSAEQIWEMFRNEYLNIKEPICYIEHKLRHGDSEDTQIIDLTLEVNNGARFVLVGEGNGPIDATIHSLRLPIDIRSYEEHSLGGGSNAKAVSFLEMTVAEAPGFHFGAGIHENFVTASVQAVISGVNRAIGLGKLKLGYGFGMSSGASSVSAAEPTRINRDRHPAANPPEVKG